MASKSIAKRPDGRWRARYRDAAGKEHAQHFTRKIDAQRWLDEVTTAVITGSYVDPTAGRITFGQWFDLWCSRQTWGPGTVQSATTVSKTITFADIEMSKLRTAHVQSWVKVMSTTGLAASTMKLRFNYVRMAMLAAVDEPVIAKDATAKVKLPVAARKSDTRVRGDDIPTAELVAAALDVSEDHFRAFVAVCALAGLRLGEAAGLRTEDVDFLGRTIRVRQQVQGTTRANTRFVEPKYGSARDVPISTALAELLARHVEVIGTREGRLFTNGPDPFNRSSAGEQWRKIRARVPGLESFTLHSLRHFYASALIASSCDVVTVQRALGHSQPSITLNVYAHLWPKAEDRTRAAGADLAARVLGAPADYLRTSGPTAH